MTQAASTRGDDMATNLLYMHRGCGPFSGLHFSAGMKKPPLRETRPDTPLDGPRILYARQEAARLLSVSVRTIDRLISTKALAVRRIGRSVLIPHVELMKLSRRDVVNV